MSEIIWQDQFGLGLSIAKFCGPERSDGGPRVMIQIDGLLADRVPLQMSVDEMLVLSGGFWSLIHASDQLPMCLESNCKYGPVPHGKWSDCRKTS